ncbi:Uncharacterized protein TCM_033529 [Theobroma cacao]|uniref:Uncharacterized protein n=1 Tax=Theobroma cacao TaxID=3641 RepID=A0A061FBH0_THECC|nr:Uncharacterized protein TCM_033529 [Theobroma cacao]
MKKKRERKNRERGRVKRMVLLHFEEGKRKFLLQFWRKKKAENFEVRKLIFLRLIAGIFEVFMADFGAENSRFLLLKLCEFAARNFGGFAALAANLYKKIGVVVTNLCRKIRQHCAANLREKRQLS